MVGMTGSDYGNSTYLSIWSSQPNEPHACHTRGVPIPPVRPVSGVNRNEGRDTNGVTNSIKFLPNTVLHACI